MKRSTKRDKYQAVAIRLAQSAMHDGMTMRACERMILTVDVHLRRGSFGDALALMLQFRTKNRPASFLTGTGHWIQQLRDDQKARAQLVRDGSLIRDTIVDEMRSGR